MSFMKKIFLGLFLIITVICFCGIIPAIAEDNPQFVFGEEVNIVEDTRAANIGRASTNLNFINSIYATAIERGSIPIKYYSLGETVYLATTFYMASAGNVELYYFISNAAGSIVGMSGSTATVTSGWQVASKSTTPPAPGIYVFNQVILATGNHMMPVSGFIFIVE
jgi:hypothetical protein